MALHEECKDKNRRPSFNELRNLIEDLCRNRPRTYIVVDALDECEAIRRREQLLPMLEILAVSGTKIFVTSRPNNEDILQTLGDASQIPIVAHEKDVSDYIMQRLDVQRKRVKGLTPELKEEITLEVSKKVDGMYGLLSRVIEILCTESLSQGSCLLRSRSTEYWRLGPSKASGPLSLPCQESWMIYT